MGPIDLLSVYYLAAPISHVFVLGVEAACAAAVAIGIVEKRRAERAAEEEIAAVGKDQALSPGARFIAGEVELAEGEPVAIRIFVTQFCYDENKSSGRPTAHGWFHVWKEIRREATIRPFYVRHASGARIRVEPPERVLVIDKLDEPRQTEQRLRIQQCEVTPGERVTIEGMLVRAEDPEAKGGGGYRGGREALVMKPSEKGEMLVSTEEPGRRFSLRARAFRRVLGPAIGAFVAIQVLFASYFARLLVGQDVTYIYEGAQRREDGLYDSILIIDTGERIEEPYDQWNHIEGYLSAGKKRPGQLVPAFPWAAGPGRGAAVSFWASLVAGVLAGYVLRKTLRVDAYRRWYEGKMEQLGGQGKAPPWSS